MPVYKLMKYYAVKKTPPCDENTVSDNVQKHEQ